MTVTPGVLALVGGGEFRDGCSFDRILLDESGAEEVLVLPTAAAFEHPQRLVDQAEQWFAGLGAKVRGLDVLRRPDALDEGHAATVRGARFVYLAGSSPMHLRSVLKDSPVWDALVQAWQHGAALAGSSAGAMVLTDPMVDPRGGAFTVGIGVVAPLAVIPHVDMWSEDKAHRTRVLAPKATPVVGVDERTALLRLPDGTWRTEGAGDVRVWLAGEPADLSVLPA
ncbi:MAG: Type 1 glutamine amidotransferase-like domain-containing protein [Acidimicrobiales bacterium]